MIRAGEVSGNIDFVFEKMSAYYDREHRLKNKLLAAAIYPMILVFVTLLSLIFMLVGLWFQILRLPLLLIWTSCQ